MYDTEYCYWHSALFHHPKVIRSIAGPVLTVTIFASYVHVSPEFSIVGSKLVRIVAYLDTQGTCINLPNNVVPLLSVVVGLILVFRLVSQILVQIYD